MRHEPIEFGMMSLAQRAAEDRIARLAKRLARRSRDSVMLPPAEAVDEAFAGFAKTNARRTRIDGPSDGAPLVPVECANKLNNVATWGTYKHELVADLAKELSSLDRQRERLAKLLHDIDNAGSTEPQYRS